VGSRGLCPWRAVSLMGLNVAGTQRLVPGGFSLLDLLPGPGLLPARGKDVTIAKQQLS
jgi:hypothetical protein